MHRDKASEGPTCGAVEEAGRRGHVGEVRGRRVSSGVEGGAVRGGGGAGGGGVRSGGVGPEAPPRRGYAYSGALSAGVVV